MKRNYQKELDQLLEQIPYRQGGQQAAPKLLLHSCCAPCSSYVLEYLSQYFQITVFYYNPNIYPEEEYFKRAKEQEEFIRRFQQSMEPEKAGGGQDVSPQQNAGEAFICPSQQNAGEAFICPSQQNAGKAQRKAGSACLPRQLGEPRVCHRIGFLEGSYDKEKFYGMAKGLESLKEGGERCFGCYRLRLEETARYAKELGMDYFTTTLSISPMKNAGKLNEIGEQLAEEYGIRYLSSDFKKRDGYKRSVELSREYGMYRQDYCGCIFSMQERQEKQRQLSAGIGGKSSVSYPQG